MAPDSIDATALDGQTLVRFEPFGESVRITLITGPLIIRAAVPKQVLERLTACAVAPAEQAA